MRHGDVVVEIHRLPMSEAFYLHQMAPQGMVSPRHACENHHVSSEIAFQAFALCGLKLLHRAMLRQSSFFLKVRVFVNARGILMASHLSLNDRSSW